MIAINYYKEIARMGRGETFTSKNIRDNNQPSKDVQTDKIYTAYHTLIANQQTNQHPTEGESQKAPSGNEMRSKMHALCLKTGLFGAGSLGLSMIALSTLASPIGAAALFVVALASLFTSIRAKFCADHAAQTLPVKEAVGLSEGLQTTSSGYLAYYALYQQE